MQKYWCEEASHTPIQHYLHLPHKELKQVERTQEICKNIAFPCTVWPQASCTHANGQMGKLCSSEAKTPPCPQSSRSMFLRSLHCLLTCRKALQASKPFKSKPLQNQDLTKSKFVLHFTHGTWDNQVAK